MVVVWNRADHEIVVRHQPNGHYRVGPNQSVIVNVAEAAQLELFATHGRDEQMAYARILVKKDTPDVHFTNEGGAFGQGKPSISREQNTTSDFNLSFLAPRSLTAAADEPPVAQFEPVSKTVAAPFGEASTQTVPHETVQQQQQSEMIYIEGLGHVQKSSVPPNVLEQMQQRAAPQQYAPPPPAPIQYVQKTASSNRSWLLPLSILLVLVSILLYTFRKKIGF